MDESEFKEGRLLLRRSAAEKKPLILRLNRIEGQVRGLKQMIEQDRYCADELLQIKATIAALRSVAKLVTEQHILESAKHFETFKEREMARADLARVLEEVLKLF